MTRRYLPSLFNFIKRQRRPTTTLRLRLRTRTLGRLRNPNKQRHPRQKRRGTQVNTSVIRGLLHNTIINRVTTPLTHSGSLLAKLINVLRRHCLVPLPRDNPHHRRPNHANPRSRRLYRSNSSHGSLPIRVYSDLSCRGQPTVTVYVPLREHEGTTSNHIYHLKSLRRFYKIGVAIILLRFRVSVTFLNTFATSATRFTRYLPNASHLTLFRHQTNRTTRPPSATHAILSYRDKTPTTVKANRRRHTHHKTLSNDVLYTNVISTIIDTPITRNLIMSRLVTTMSVRRPTESQLHKDEHYQATNEQKYALRHK